MVEKLFVFLPTVSTFVLNALPHQLQNLTVKLAIDSFTRRYEFLVGNALDVGKNDQHGLDIAVNLTRFFWPRWIWRLPLWRLLLSLRVITINPCFITGYDIGDEVGVLACCLSSLQTETRRAFWSLLSSLGTNLAEMCLMFKLSAKMRLTVPYDSPTISQTWWIVYLWSARIASRTFAMFVDGHPEHSSLLTDVRPSLKRLHHKKVSLWLMALSQKASCSIQWVSAAVVLRLKQNLM